jgi:hypothetical protein
MRRLPGSTAISGVPDLTHNPSWRTWRQRDGRNDESKKNVASAAHPQRPLRETNSPHGRSHN